MTKKEQTLSQSVIFLYERFRTMQVSKLIVIIKRTLFSICSEKEFKAVFHAIQNEVT